MFITTETNEIPKYVESWESLSGNVAQVVRFPHRLQSWMATPLEELIRRAYKEFSPDLFVYVGACAGRMPDTKYLAKLNHSVAPTVILISDAADKPWWSMLHEYEKVDAFKVMVAIDGNKDWPYSDKHITCLTPIDPKRFQPKPHAERTQFFGFAGNTGGLFRGKDGALTGRKILVEALVKLGLKTRQRDKQPAMGDGSYQGCCDFMCDTRIIPNFPRTGSYERFHVKGRVVECGLAGAMLLEQAGSPTPEWFEQGVDYLEWNLINDAKAIIKRFEDRPDETQAMGERLRQKVLANHSPDKFWGRILERLQ